MTVNDEICAYHVLEPTPSDVASSRRIASHGINAILAGLEPPSASMGVEVSGVSGSEKMALMEKSDVKESIDVLRGRWFGECE